MDLPRRILQADLALAARRWPTLVAPHLGADFALPAAAGRLPAGQIWPAGEFVYVPVGYCAAEPIAVGPRPGDEPAVLQRSLMVLGAGAAVTLVAGCTAPRLSLAPRSVQVLDLVLGDGASCRFSHLAHGSAPGSSWSARRVQVGRGAQLTWTDVELGSGFTWRALAVHLSGAGARLSHRALALCGPGRRATWQAELRAEAPGTQVSTVWRGLGWGDGRLDGKVTWSASPKAHGATFELDGRGLELDPSARIAIMPPTAPAILGSRANSEAASQPPDPAALFYARSRGLSAAEALGMLAAGFAAPALCDLPPDFAADLERLIPLSLAGAAS